MRAMILAAGRGTRLGALTEQTPKCLMQVGGQPMLWHVLQSLRTAGVTEAVINLHHLASQVEQWVGEYVHKMKSSELRLELSFESVLLGTGGGLKKVREFFQRQDDFLMVNADIFCEFPLSQLVQARRSSKSMGTLLTMSRADSSYLLFGEDDRFIGHEVVGRSRTVIDSHNSGTKAQVSKQRAFCGIQVLTPKIFDYMGNCAPEFSIIDAYMNAARAGEAITECDIAGAFWCDMGSPEKLLELRKRWEPSS